MWEYHGVDHNNDFLQHWKYTRREMKNGRWQYYYDNGKNTVPHAQVKAQQNNNAGYRRAQTHSKVSKQTRNNIAVTNSKRTAGEEIKSGINRKLNELKLSTRPKIVVTTNVYSDSVYDYLHENKAHGLEDCIDWITERNFPLVIVPDARKQ